MLQEILKSATKNQHDELENLMFVQEIMSKTLSLDQYRTVLATNYRVHAAIEPQIHEALDQRLRDQLAITGREKTAALEKDLVEAGLDKEELAAFDLSFVQLSKPSFAAALGAMYVLEGATLGGNVILKKLRANPVFATFDLYYYNVYGENLVPNWKSFVQVLNSSVPEEGYNEAVESATAMFSQIAAVSRAVREVLA